MENKVSFMLGEQGLTNHVACNKILTSHILSQQWCAGIVAEPCSASSSANSYRLNLHICVPGDVTALQHADAHLKLREKYIIASFRTFSAQQPNQPRHNHTP